MNRLESRGPARIRYMDAEFEVIVPGSYVLCAVTGRQIPIDELKYWSVDRQEAYADIAASVIRERETRPHLPR
ncbi:MAG: DUF2093 domain-containing protein [Phyllobacteriaceae bacterium]|nr:DUF2093 domain-containing protein [Phyllobacteriaceae bacterium]